MTWRSARKAVRIRPGRPLPARPQASNERQSIAIGHEQVGAAPGLEPGEAQQIVP